MNQLYRQNLPAKSKKLEPIVAIRQLNYSLGKGSLRQTLLKNINLEIYPGEIVFLKGPSGSGKTTLLTLIGALRSVQEGSLRIIGQELFGVNKKQLTKIRRQIGFIFQTHNLLECLKAWENVSMALKLQKQIDRREYRKRAGAILHAVGLGHRVDYYPDKLSEGQKQRVAIARALVSCPKLLLADEPTSSLDSQSGRAVVQIIQHLAKNEGCTVLLVTHDDRIIDIAERIFKMEDGYLSLQH